MTMVIASLFPELTNSQGDAENARALSKVLEFHGREARVEVVATDGSAPAQAELIVFGHVVASQEALVAEGLSNIRVWLNERLAAGAVLLAVGSAQNVLCDAGLLSGHGEQRTEHAVDDLVAVRDGFARELWGFQNSQTVYRRGSDEQALGTVVFGSGSADGNEGVIRQVGSGLIVGTNLHGPVCVRNPEFALWLIAQAGIELPADSATAGWRQAVTLANALWEQRRVQLELK